MRGRKHCITANIFTDVYYWSPLCCQLLPMSTYWLIISITNNKAKQQHTLPVKCGRRDQQHLEVSYTIGESGCVALSPLDQLSITIPSHALWRLRSVSGMKRESRGCRSEVHPYVFPPAMQGCPSHSFCHPYSECITLAPLGWWEHAASCTSMT